jgi:hypothetical protein
MPIEYFERVMLKLFTSILIILIIMSIWWTQNKEQHRIWYICFIFRYFTKLWNGKLTTIIHDISDGFDFGIVIALFFYVIIYHFHFSYGVYISQLIRYARACFAYEDFSKWGKLLTNKVTLQGYNESCLKLSFRKF